MSVESLLAEVRDGFHAGRSFGPVIERDDCLIIPVAVSVSGGGGGDAPQEGGTAVGAGFGTVSWPLGVYVVRNGEARWRPAIDTTLIALGVITAMRGTLRLLRRRMRK